MQKAENTYTDNELTLTHFDDFINLFKTDLYAQYLKNVLKTYWTEKFGVINNIYKLKIEISKMLE